MANRYNNRAYVSSAPGAYYPIYASDFGAPVPAVATLVSQATGSIQTTVADFFVEVTWVTAEGEGVASPEATIALNSATTYGVKVARPTAPTQGQTVLGWRIYSAYATTAETLNTVPDTTVTGAPVPCIAIATTQVTLLVAASSVAAKPPTTDGSGIQAPMPLVPANTTVEYYAVVPNTGSQWKQQKSVDFMRADGTADPAGITLNHLDFIQPVYPGYDTTTSAYAQAAVATGTWMVMNGYLFLATQSGTQNTAATFIGWAAFNTAKGKTTTDGSVVWTSYGKAGLVRFDFGNTSGSAATPASQEYSLFQS